MTSKTKQPMSTLPSTPLSTAEAKRRFSELLDRVGEGERFLVSRHGRPAVALVPPTPEALQPRQPPRGLASLAGALAEWEQLDEDVAAIYSARRGSEDRPAPDLG
jgi:prevent-host-death family protein